MTEKKRDCGCIAFGTPDQDGSTNAHIQNGLHLNRLRMKSVFLDSSLRRLNVGMNMILRRGPSFWDICVYYENDENEVGEIMWNLEG